MRPILRVLIFLVALPVAAQEPIVVTPGSDLIDLDGLAPGTTTYTVTVVQNGMRHPFGTVTRHVTLDEAAGEAEFVMVVDITGNKVNDTTRVAWPSLEARAHRSETAQRRLRYDVADGRLAGEHHPTDGDAASFELAVGGPTYDSATLATIAAALPLDEGFVATVPAYEYEAGGVAEYTVRVVDSEKLAREGKAPVDVWVVEASRPGGEEMPTYYFAKDDHDLVRIRIVPQEGIEVLVDAE